MKERELAQPDDFDSVRDGISGFLHGLETEYENSRKSYGLEIPDYKDALRGLNVMEMLRSAQDVPSFFNHLFELGIPPGVLSTMSKKVDIPLPDGKYVFTEDHIKDKFFGEGLVSEENLAGLNCKFGGDEWLKQFVTDQRAQKKFNMQDAHLAQRIANSVSSFGPRASIMMRLMFMCSMPEQGEKKRGKHTGRTVQELEQVARVRKAESPKAAAAEGKDFFEQMEDFFSIYSDVTAGVLKNTTDTKLHAQIEERARIVLSRFLQTNEFQNVTDKAEGFLNPFETFRNMLLENNGKNENNPWLANDCANTPFDAGKFGLIISPEIPRGLTIDSLTFLNDYSSFILADKVSRVVKAANSTPARKKGEPIVSAKLRNRITETLEEIGIRATDTAESADNLSRQITQLNSFLRNNLVHKILTDTNRIHPFSALLRMIDPEKITRDESRKQEFLFLVSEISELINKEKGTEDSAENAKKIAIVASSVKIITDAPDPNLDIPIPGGEKDLSMRLYLAIRAQRWFDKGILEGGPFAHLPRRGPRAEGPLIIPRDILEMSPARLDEIKKDYNPAAGVSQSKRGWIARACAAWNRTSADSYELYEHIKRFSFRMAEAFWKGAGKYEYAFYPSATAAVDDVVGRLFPRITKDDCLLISNQEFSGVTEVFTKRGATVADVKCNDRLKGMAKDADAIFEDFKTKIEALKRPKPIFRDINEKPQLQKKRPTAILLSSKTRFGDAIGHVNNIATPNSHGLGILVKKLKEYSPTIPVIVDGCQSIGRNDVGEELQRLGCDIYISGGGKALGVGNIGFLAARRVAPEEKEKSWLSHIDEDKILKNPCSILRPGSGTEDIRRIGEFGIALQLLMLNIDTWKSVPVNDKRQMRERAAEHMQRLTYQAIGKAGEYTMALLTNKDFPVPVGDAGKLITNAEVQKQFGCHVVYPVHRKGRDYDGILTVTFPNIAAAREGKDLSGDNISAGENYMKEQLGKLGYPVEQCHFGRRGVRISFHYLHEAKDVDELFKIMEKIHIDFLTKLVARKGIKTFAELQKESPNISDDWMED